jgi:hypothetical protein
VIPTSNQDGHQAKNRKKGDDIFKKSSPFLFLATAAILNGGRGCQTQF